MHDFTVWVSYGKWRKNGDIRYCLLHLIHLSSTRLRRCGRILSGICEPYCLITPDLTMRYCPILILIDYIVDWQVFTTILSCFGFVFDIGFNRNGAFYSGLTLNQYGVASPCRTICTVCGFIALSWFKFNPLYMFPKQLIHKKGRLKIFRRPFGLQASYMKKIAAMATAITP